MIPDIVRRLVDSYRLEPIDQGNEIRQILSNPEDQEIVKQWLEKSQEIKFCPLLQNLKGRISPLPSSSRSSSTINTLTQLLATDVSELERLILSKNFDGLTHYFRKPSLLFENADLLKAHLRLGTLGLNDLLLVLKTSAEEQSAYGEPFPSLLRIFSSELLTTPFGDEEQQVFKHLIKQDDRAADSLLKSTEGGEFLVSLLLKSRLSDIDTKIAPSLLKSMRTNKELAEIARFFGLLSNLNEGLLTKLSPSQRALLDTVFYRAKIKSPAVLVPYQVQNSLFDKGDIIQSIYHESDLPMQEKCILIAAYIEANKIPVRSFQYRLGSGAMLDLAPYLKYVDLREIPICDIYGALLLEQNWLHKCSNINHLVIRDLFISDILALPSCKYLDCSNCINLRKLPVLPNCKYLDCSKCINLQEIPALPSCVDLNCSGCASLQVLPALPSCECLDCKGCTSLQAVPALPSCVDLNCKDCTSLRELLALPSCIDLVCKGCTSLQALPALPSCEYLDCRGCTSLRELPELHFNARVETDLAWIKIKIDVGDFAIAPKKLLLKVGKYLLERPYFPNVYYFLKGQLSEGIDVGGVRRDFVSRLFEHLFKVDSKNEGFLHLNKSGLPVGDKDQIDCYRSIGKIFAICYQKKSCLKTGPLAFSDAVYACIARPLEPVDEWLLTNYLQLRSAPPAAYTLMNLQKPAPSLESNDLTFLSTLAETCLDTPGAIVLNQGHFQANRQQLRSAVLEEAKQQREFSLIWHIAKSMKESLGEATWNSLCLEGGQLLREKIEGTLSADELLEKLSWEVSAVISRTKAAEIEKTKEYLKTWRTKANIEDLRKFVRAVTSNNSLSSEPIKIELFDREKGFIPVAHTCCFSLELSVNYPTQDHFNKKLKYLLKEGLAGSGFQFA